jgi:hypothetical protein
MTPDDQQRAGELWVGAPVYCRDGEMLGHVKAVRTTHFKVNAPLQPDYWLRREIVLRSTTEGVTIAVPKDHLSAAHVDDPDLDAGPASTPASPTSAPPDYVPVATPPDYVPNSAPEQHRSAASKDLS